MSWLGLAGDTCNLGRGLRAQSPSFLLRGFSVGLCKVGPRTLFSAFERQPWEKVPQEKRVERQVQDTRGGKKAGGQWTNASFFCLFGGSRGPRLVRAKARSEGAELASQVLKPAPLSSHPPNFCPLGRGPQLPASSGEEPPLPALKPEGQGARHPSATDLSLRGLKSLFGLHWRTGSPPVTGGWEPRWTPHHPKSELRAASREEPLPPAEA